MRTVTVRHAFTGYPDDTVASERQFVAGEQPTLPDDYAALLIAKGHADPAGPKLPVLPIEPAPPATLIIP